MEKIEAAAMAVHEALDDSTCWEWLDDDVQESYREVARVAIEAWKSIAADVIPFHVVRE